MLIININIIKWMKTFQFKLKGNLYMMEVDDIDANSINTIRYRSDEFIPKNPYLSTKVLAITNKDEFISDIKLQLNYLNQIKEDITGDSFTEALYHACSRHIQNFQRLIDTDLYTYIDINMHIFDSILHLPINQIKNIYSELVMEAIDKYKNYYYVSDPILGLRKYLL